MAHAANLHETTVGMGRKKGGCCVRSVDCIEQFGCSVLDDANKT